MSPTEPTAKVIAEAEYETIQCMDCDWIDLDELKRLGM